MCGFLRLTTRKGTRIPPNGVQGPMWFFTYLGSCGQGACRSGVVQIHCVYCRWVCWVDTYGCQDEHYQWRGWQILCWPNSWPCSLELRLFDVWGPLLPGSRRKDVCKGGAYAPFFARLKNRDAASISSHSRHHYRVYGKNLSIPNTCAG